MIGKLKQMENRLNIFAGKLKYLAEDNPLTMEILAVLYFWVSAFIVSLAYVFSDNFNLAKLLVAMGFVGSVAMIIVCIRWTIKGMTYIIKNFKNIDIESIDYIESK